MIDGTRQGWRFDISSPIWALPDKACRGGGLDEKLARGRGFKGAGQPRMCRKGVCSDQRWLHSFPSDPSVTPPRSTLSLSLFLSFSLFLPHTRLCETSWCHDVACHGRKIVSLSCGRSSNLFRSFSIFSLH